MSGWGGASTQSRRLSDLSDVVEPTDRTMGANQWGHCIRCAATYPWL